VSAATGLTELGWDAEWEAAWDAGRTAAWSGDGRVPARVVAEHRGSCEVVTRDDGTLTGTLAGRLRHEALVPGSLPVVGDWVAIDARPDEGTATIHAVLPRRTRVQRRSPGDHASPLQVLAANVDAVGIATSLNRDLNPRRLERYLAMAWDSGARPVILLTKVDLAANPVEVAVAEAQLEEAAPEVLVIATSGINGDGLGEVRALIPPGRTLVLVGSSGVGKSTLANALLGEDRLATRAIREDDARGRHTTSGRQIVRIPGGGLLLDTPGIRELGLWDEGDGLASTFAEVDRLAADCRFSDCGHEREPGCAVQAAVATGDLAAERLSGWRRLAREERHRALEMDAVARRAEERRWAQLTRSGATRARLKRSGLIEER
jgi:ribosome biogenesis GTPase / thiamine phosphate phosphatase